MNCLETHKSLENMFHAMDTWHKGKCLTKTLHKAAQVKGQDELRVWIDSIVNHFWYCSEQCKGDLELLKVDFCDILNLIVVW